MKAFCIFALFLLVRGENVCEEKTVNECVDIVIEKAKEKIPHPSGLRDFETHVLSRGIEFTEGVMWGVDELQKIGPMKLLKNVDMHMLIGQLGIDMLTARYKWTSFFRKHLRSGNVVFKAENITIDFHVEPNYDPKAHPIIDVLHINHMVVSDLQISGIGYLTWLASALTDNLNNKIKDIVTTFIENKVRIALQREFYQIQFPANLEV